VLALQENARFPCSGWPVKDDLGLLGHAKEPFQVVPDLKFDALDTGVGRCHVYTPMALWALPQSAIFSS
jgi:hypothetical protein